MKRSPITTHVLDTARGTPAAGIEVSLRRVSGDANELGRGTTNADGRVTTGLVTAEDFSPGVYQLTFDVGDYFQHIGVDGFYRRIRIEFIANAGQDHFHVPLLLSPFGYSTYRGS